MHPVLLLLLKRAAAIRDDANTAAFASYLIDQNVPLVQGIAPFSRSVSQQVLTPAEQEAAMPRDLRKHYARGVHPYAHFSRLSGRAHNAVGFDKTNPSFRHVRLERHPDPDMALHERVHVASPNSMLRSGLIGLAELPAMAAETAATAQMMRNLVAQDPAAAAKGYGDPAKVLQSRTSVAQDAVGPWQYAHMLKYGPQLQMTPPPSDWKPQPVDETIPSYDRAFHQGQHPDGSGAADAASIDAWTKQLLSPDNELGRRYQDYMKHTLAPLGAKAAPILRNRAKR